MTLRRSEEGPGEPRYDAQTLRKVTALAERLQSRHQATWSAQDIESIGREVGLDPAFMRQALAQLEQKAPAPATAIAPPAPRGARALAKAWWAAGWVVPFVLVILGEAIFHEAISAALFFLGWGIYIGGGIFLSHSVEEEAPQLTAPVSRAALLEMLFALQRQLEGQQLHRAFLSVDVVGSSDMKQSGPALAAEYSFGQYRRWVEETARACGGEMQSAAGDGVMCMFPTDEGALRAARFLQEDQARFNRDQNRLPVPFRIRCGVSAGQVAVEEGTPLGHMHSPVIDRAAALQKRAEPGDILLGSEVAAAALMELGSATRLPEPVAGQPAFSWRAGQPTALPDQTRGNAS
jgi:class 3 adenylate cyclase